MFKNNYSIEVEYIYVNKMVRNVAVYYGEVNKVIILYFILFRLLIKKIINLLSIFLTRMSKIFICRNKMRSKY